MALDKDEMLQLIEELESKGYSKSANTAETLSVQPVELQGVSQRASETD